MITPYDHTLCAREIRYAIAFGLDEEDASVQAASINIFLTATGQFLGPVFGAAMVESYGGAAHPPGVHTRLHTTVGSHPPGAGTRTAIPSRALPYAFSPRRPEGGFI